MCLECAAAPSGAAPGICDARGLRSLAELVQLSCTTVESLFVSTADRDVAKFKISSKIDYIKMHENKNSWVFCLCFCSVLLIRKRRLWRKDSGTLASVYYGSLHSTVQQGT